METDWCRPLPCGQTTYCLKNTSILKIPFAITAILALPLACEPSTADASSYAEVWEKGKYVKKETVTLGDLKEFPTKEKVFLNTYGGWKKIRTKPTGFFHTQKIENRWWIIDPHGYVFLSVGLNSVYPNGQKDISNLSNQNLAWGTDTVKHLKNLGFNTLGCWSVDKIFRKITIRMPYCLRWNFMSNYRKIRKTKYPATDQFNVIYPFDPEYEDFCNKHAKQTLLTRDDPWLLGHFSDNELPFQEKGIVTKYLNHSPDDPNHLEAKRFMANRNNRKPTREDDRDFQKLVVETHYRKVSQALKKHDPNHMYLGTRFHGMALHSPGIFEGAGKYADIISVNYYHRWTPEDDRLTRWSKLASKPILITEWYAMAEDSGLPTQKFGAGFSVKTQGDRAKFYQHFTLGLLQNKSIVGWHWFKYQDGQNNAGIINNQSKSYPAIQNAMKRINLFAYPAIAVFD